MWVAETNTLDEIWNQLQAPGYPTVIEPGYWMLPAALDMGWKVEEPVTLRPRECGPRVYHFSLRHASLPSRRLTAAEGPEIDRLVRTEGLTIRDEG